MAKINPYEPNVGDTRNTWLPRSLRIVFVVAITATPQILLLLFGRLVFERRFSLHQDITPRITEESPAQYDDFFVLNISMAVVFGLALGLVQLVSNQANNSLSTRLILLLVTSAVTFQCTLWLIENIWK